VYIQSRKRNAVSITFELENKKRRTNTEDPYDRSLKKTEREREKEKYIFNIDEQVLVCHMEIRFRFHHPAKIVLFV